MRIHEQPHPTPTYMHLHFPLLPRLHLQLWADGSLGFGPHSEPPPPQRHLDGILLGAEGKCDDGGGLGLKDGDGCAEGGLVVVVLTVVKYVGEPCKGLVPTVLACLLVAWFGSCRKSI